MAVKKKFPYKAAIVACNGGCHTTRGLPACSYGCMSCSACIEACPFQAITYNEYGVAQINETACAGCGKCARVCPQGIIHVHDCANYIVVKCSNQDKGSAAKQMCQVSCIGCGICEKACTANAIRVTKNHAVIDETYCLSCGMCAVKCPRGAIYDLRGILRPER